ncbi:hypothetical protein Tco_1091998 [Tanacetum coccineum]|uniref:Uncharacterized protein n=1 Tax=Tanacetum coccineum TaxID=301880 RepID=A0ABQ5I9Y8_9ASTR
MLAPKCATYNGRSTFANPKYLKKAQSDKPRLYEIPYDTSDPANRFCPNGEETVTLEKESRSKLDKEQNLKAKCKTQEHVIYEVKKLILGNKGKSVETQFDKPSVVRQPNAQRIPKPSVLGKPTPFSNSPEMRNHDALCSDSRKDVNARTKKPKVVPIRARIPTVLLKRKNKLGESSGKHLLTDSRGSDLYTISLKKQLQSTPSCFMLKLHQLKHGYGIEDFLILTSITSRNSQRKML